MLPKFDYVRAASVDEAVTALSSAEDRVHAGGTDLLGCLRDEVFPVRKVVSLGALPGLRGIERTTDGGLRIGSMTTLQDVEKSALVRRGYPGLSRAAGEVGSPQLRNQGTLGGNLCQRPRCWYFRGEFPCLKKGGDTCYAVEGDHRYHAVLGGGPCFIVHPSDTAPMLVALGAAARIRGRDGNRTVPLGRFFRLPEDRLEGETALEPGEIVTEILLPPVAGDSRSSYLKIRERGSWSFALVSVALALRLDGDRVEFARVVLGGVAPAPWRSREAEQVLLGRRLDRSLATEAAEAAARPAEPLDTNAYKVPLLRGAVERSVLEMASATSR